MSRKLNLLSLLIIIAFSIGVYANTIKNGFVYDDKFTIVDSVFIRDFNNLPKLFKKEYFALSGEITYRPVVTFTYFLDYALYGLRPWGYHLINGFIHAINGVLLYAFLAIIIQQSGFSGKSPSVDNLLPARPLLLSLLFATHPVLTEAVNAISFREDLLTTLFYIAALSLYLILRSKSNMPRRRAACLYGLSCVSYVLALFSKEMAATLPLAVFCYDWVFSVNRKGRLHIPLNIYIVGYIAITFIYVYVNFYYFDNHSGKGAIQIAQEEYLYGGTFRTTLFTMMTVVAYYIRLLLFPINLCGDYFQYELSYSFDSSVIAAAFFILALIIPAFFGKKQCPLIAFGIFFFFIALLPVSNIIPLKNLLAERYLYLPSIGFFIFLAGAITSVGDKPRYGYVRLFLLVISLVFFSALTYKRNFVWRDQFSFWADAVKKMPGNSRAHYNLALSQPDIEIRIKELKTALRLNPTDDLALSKLAWMLYQKGDYDGAVEYYTSLLERKPGDKKVMNGLGIVYFAKGDYKNAREVFEKAIVSDRNNPQLLNNLGSVYDMLEEHDKAVQMFNRAVDIAPHNVEAYYNLGLAYNSMGKYKEAETSYKKAMEIDKGSERAHIGLGETYFNMGNYSGAIPEFKEAINANPINPTPYYNLAYIYASEKDFRASMDWLERAVERGFKDIESLKKEKVFTPLREDSRFKKLVIN